jgi:hypothetical protein
VFARCIANSAQAVHQYLGALFVSQSARFPLTVDAIYPVLGMELYRDTLQLLIPDNSDMQYPQWMPLELFDVGVAKIPAFWCFRSYGDDSAARQRGFRARWGYRQLVESDEHRDGLEELDPDALAIFATELALTKDLEGRDIG